MKNKIIIILCLVFILNFFICTIIGALNSPSKLILASEMSKDMLLYSVISTILGVLSFINMFYVFLTDENDK